MNLLDILCSYSLQGILYCLPFMHMEGEKSALRYAVVLIIFLIMYLLFIL
jgi:cytochrome c oxidase subunit IV